MRKAWTLTAEVSTAKTVAVAARHIRKEKLKRDFLKLEGLLELALVLLKEEGLSDDVRELIHCAAVRGEVQLNKRGRWKRKTSRRGKSIAKG